MTGEVIDTCNKGYSMIHGYYLSPSNYFPVVSQGMALNAEKIMPITFLYKK